MIPMLFIHACICTLLALWQVEKKGAMNVSVVSAILSQRQKQQQHELQQQQQQQQQEDELQVFRHHSIHPSVHPVIHPSTHARDSGTHLNGGKQNGRLLYISTYNGNVCYGNGYMCKRVCIRRHIRIYVYIHKRLYPNLHAQTSIPKLLHIPSYIPQLLHLPRASCSNSSGGDGAASRWAKVQEQTTTKER